MTESIEWLKQSFHRCSFLLKKTEEFSKYRTQKYIHKIPRILQEEYYLIFILNQN